MAVAHLLLAIVAYAIGVVVIGNAQSALHEIEAGMCFIIGTLFVVASQVADSSAANRRKADRQANQIKERMERIADQVDELASDTAYFRDLKANEMRQRTRK